MTKRRKTHTQKKIKTYMQHEIIGGNASEIYIKKNLKKFMTKWSKKYIYINNMKTTLDNYNPTLRTEQLIKYNPSQINIITCQYC